MLDQSQNFVRQCTQLLQMADTFICVPPPFVNSALPDILGDDFEEAEFVTQQCGLRTGAGIVRYFPLGIGFRDIVVHGDFADVEAKAEHGFLLFITKR